MLKDLEDNIKFLYEVITSNGPPTPDMEAIGKALGLKKLATSKRWSRLKATIREGGKFSDSAYQYLWLVIKHSQRAKAPNWKDIAAKYKTTPGAAAKRYSRMKVAWEKGTPATNASKPKLRTAASSNTKKEATAMELNIGKYGPGGDEHDDPTKDDLDIRSLHKKQKPVAKNKNTCNTAAGSREIDIIKSEDAITTSPSPAEKYTGIQNNPGVQHPIQQPTVTMKPSDGCVGVRDNFVDVNEQLSPYYVPTGFQSHPPVPYDSNVSQGSAGGELILNQTSTHNISGFQETQYVLSQEAGSQELISGVDNDHLPFHGPSSSHDYHRASSPRPVGPHGFNSFNEHDGSNGFDDFHGKIFTHNHPISNGTGASSELAGEHPNGNTNQNLYYEGGCQDLFDVKLDPDSTVQSTDDFYDQFLDYNEYIAPASNS